MRSALACVWVCACVCLCVCVKVCVCVCESDNQQASWTYVKAVAPEKPPRDPIKAFPDSDSSLTAHDRADDTGNTVKVSRLGIPWGVRLHSIM